MGAPPKRGHVALPLATACCLLVLLAPGPVAAQELEVPGVDAAPAQTESPPDAPPPDAPQEPQGSAPPAADPSDGGTTQRRQTETDGDADAADDPGVEAAQTDRDCADFSTQGEAQDYFDRNGGSPTNNVDNLDADGDGIACENLPSGDGAPVGGVDTGGGGTVPTPGGPDEPSPLAFVLTGAGLGLIPGGVLAVIGRRRRRASA